MQQINVNTPSGPYAVIYERGVLARAGAAISSHREATGVWAISSPRIWKHFGRKLEQSFAGHGGLRVLLMNDAEGAKTLRTVEKLCRNLARARADRGAMLLAVGGGVVGDVAGFVAACYQRGIRVVQVPTTLVAQVDSAIGGKTGVNLPDGKNLVGAFHQPRLVLVDPETLRTLPDRQFRSGIYEVIKYGVIGDAELFAELEAHLDDLVRGAPAVLDRVVPRCISAKAEIVSQDEREADLRRVLNFGHTAGHALEAATRYRRFLHGEAVGWGMIFAARLAGERGLLSAEDAQRIVRLIFRVGPLPPWPHVQPQKLLHLMRGDKKTVAGRLHFVLPRRIGEVEIVPDIPEPALDKTLAGMRAFRGGEAS